MRWTLKCLTLCIICYAYTCPVAASSVDETVAQTAAVNFFKLNTKQPTGRADITAHLIYVQHDAANNPVFYVFDMAPFKGFVMIAADDHVVPVLGWSDGNSFSIPPAASAPGRWLTGKAVQISRAVQLNQGNSSAEKALWNNYLHESGSDLKSAAGGVAPLLSTQWAQEPYYNQFCPYNAADSMQTVTGCVATAMAQIMKYWNYPAQGIGSYGYLDAPPVYFNNNGDQYANFGATTYQWQNMPDSINAPNAAIATLMYQCGVAVTMDYGDDRQGGSGAYVLASDVAGWRHSAQMAYTTYFGYNAKTLQGVHASNYSNSGWIKLIEGELNAGRPVQYAGTDTNEGSHTWVCDGYDANNMLHMNWGWGGADNGYFNVSVLAADGYNFSSDEEALIGIEPANDLAVTATNSSAAICNGDSTSLQATASWAGVTYLWSPAKGLACTTCASTLASPATTTVYTVTIDSAGLSASTQITVVVNANPVAEALEINDATCYGFNNGSAKITVTGGAGNYTYTWTNGTDSSAIFGLPAGNYSVTAIDSKGCSVSVAAVVGQPGQIAVTITVDSAACSLANAALTATPSGGTPAYYFFWGNGETANTISSPVSGNYTVTASDANGCTASNLFWLAQPDSINAEIISANTSCSLLYATAAVNVTGGNGNFSFWWSNGDTTESVSNITAGSYTVTVTDALGCSSTASYNFTNPDSMSVNISTIPVADNNDYVKVTANVTGGSPEYLYAWSNGATGAVITGTPSTLYTVTITDTKGCSKIATAATEQATGITPTDTGFGFEIYPNPANAGFNVIVDAGAKNDYALCVKNMLGQTLLSQAITSPCTKINTLGFAPGTYLVNITGNNRSVTNSLMITR